MTHSHHNRMSFATKIPRKEQTEASMWRTVRRSSSMCSGVGTAEMALAAVSNIVNQSNALSFRVDIRTVALWEPPQHITVAGFIARLCKLPPMDAPSRKSTTQNNLSLVLGLRRVVTPIVGKNSLHATSGSLSESQKPGHQDAPTRNL